MSGAVVTATTSGNHAQPVPSDGYFDERVAARYDPLQNRRWEFERVSIPFRYAWPAELDLMAQLAGLRLRDRWSGWTREPLPDDSHGHVSVWEKPAAT